MSSSPEAIALLSGSTSPLASSLPSVLLPDAAAVQAAVQAAAVQHQLSMFHQVGARVHVLHHYHCAAALLAAGQCPLPQQRCNVIPPACIQTPKGLRASPHTTLLCSPPAPQAGGSSLLTAASADPASLLAAAAGVRQPLLPLSLNLAHQHYSAAPPAAPASCYSLGL